jgi:hypothetical protein
MKRWRVELQSIGLGSIVDLSMEKAAGVCDNKGVV